LIMDSVVLDNACGPGIVTGEIQTQVTSSNMPLIHAVDFSPQMIHEFAQKGKAEGWTNVKADIMDAQGLKFDENSFTHSITTFGILLFPDPVKAAREIYKTLRPGGVALVPSWHNSDWWLGILQDVQRAVRPHATPWEGPFTEWLGIDKLKHVNLKVVFREQAGNHFGNNDTGCERQRCLSRSDETCLGQACS
jgi:ubiquinone/menaquinone biosynthesis C-methylase UbiE